MPRMPVEGIITSPLVSGMKADELGVFMALVIYYWRIGRKPLPEKAQDLAILGRISIRGFQQCKSKVRAALAEALPRIDRAHEQAISNASNLELLRYKRAARMKADKLKSTVNSLQPVEARPKRTQTQRRIAVEGRQAGAVFVD